MRTKSRRNFFAFLILVLAVMCLTSLLLVGCAVKTERPTEDDGIESLIPDDDGDDDDGTPSDTDGDDYDDDSSVTPPADTGDTGDGGNSGDDGDDGNDGNDGDDSDDGNGGGNGGGNGDNGDNGDDPPDSSATEWDISATPVKANLIASGDNYTLEISGSGAMKSWTKADDVPWHEHADKITKIVVGNDVTSIGDYAFCDTVAPDIIVPSGIKTVGANALPNNADIYAYSTTEINAAQSGVTVHTFSETPPPTHDRHWTSWGNVGENITDAPFVAEQSYWHFGADDKPVLWKKTKVLFIGNSFTFYYQMPKQFDAIATDLGYYIETYSISVPGQTLETHAVTSSNSGEQITALLNAVNDFDYIVLQEHSTRPYTEYDKFFAALTKLKKQITDTQDHAEIYLYETWGSPASAGNSVEEIAEMEQRLYESYTQAASDLGCKVTYVGRAFTYIKSETTLNLYAGDNRHPGPIGSYLSACVHVASMLGGDVRNTTLTGGDMLVIPSEGGTAQPTSVNEKDAETLRAAAYKTVFEDAEQTDTYTVKFVYNGQVQTTLTPIVGFGITLPACTTTGNDKFSGWILDGDNTVYAAGTRIGYAQLKDKLDENDTIEITAQVREMVIAVWGRWITEANFLLVMDGFEQYCNENSLDFGKVGYIYYEGKTQNVDPYFAIADFTNQAAADNVDIAFPVGDNITNGTQSNIASIVTAFKTLDVSIQGNSTRYVAKLNDNALTNAFYEYITTAEAKAILISLT